MKEKNISLNQFVNDLLEDFFANEGDKTHLQSIDSSLDSIKNKLDDIERFSKKSLIMSNNCMVMLLHENSKNLLELKLQGYDPKDFYSGISPESTAIMEVDHEFLRGVHNYVYNYVKDKNE